MNNQFQNYSMSKNFGLQVEAGFAIVPTDKKVGLAESIFWNNFVNRIYFAVPFDPELLDPLEVRASKLGMTAR